MLQIIIFFLMLFNNISFAETNDLLFHDLDDKLQYSSFNQKDIDTFRKEFNKLESKSNDLSSFQITEIKYDVNSKKFIASNVTSNFFALERVTIMLEFLNSKITKKTHLNKNFSFFVSLADTTILPDRFIKNFDLSKVPFMLFDLSKKSFERDTKLTFLMPDLYIIQNIYEKQRKKIIKTTMKKNYFAKKDLGIWRGSQTGGAYNLEKKEAYPRGKLVWFSHNNPTYVDARFISYSVQTEDSKSGKNYMVLMSNTFGSKPEKYFMSFKNMTMYKYNISLDGNVSAWQRVPWILGSGTVLLYHSDFVQFFTPYLKEKIHYVSIKKNMSDLKEKIDYLRKNPFIAYQITKQAQKFQKKVLTRNFIIDYYAKVIQGISDKFES
tara:strand:- start:437 stop:1576 length:1140 start_codon:yes stop_codon:yes gene_type:complete